MDPLESYLGRVHYLKQLASIEVLKWTGWLLKREDRPTFFERFERERAVQYSLDSGVLGTVYHIRHIGDEPPGKRAQNG